MWLFKLLRLRAGKDLCQYCDGTRGNHGDENIVLGKYMCDICLGETSPLDIESKLKKKRLVDPYPNSRNIKPL